MAKFEGSMVHHQVYELHMPQGHGMMDQKHGKGNLSPIRGSVPQIDHGTEPSATAAGSPGTAGPEYGLGPSGNA